MSAEDRKCIKRLRARFERWELTHLRELAARQAAQIEELTAQLEAKENEASMAWADAQQAHDLLNEWVNDQPDTVIALTKDGTLHVVKEGGAA